MNSVRIQLMMIGTVALALSGATMCLHRIDTTKYTFVVVGDNGPYTDIRTLCDAPIVILDHGRVTVLQKGYRYDGQKHEVIRMDGDDQSLHFEQHEGETI